MSEQKLRHIIGERIRYQRKEKGISQEELAERAGMHPTYIGQLERGEKSATIDSLEKVTVALEITFEDLFRYIQPSMKCKDNTTLSLIVNRLHTMGEENLKVILNMITALSHYKPK